MEKRRRRSGCGEWQRRLKNEVAVSFAAFAAAVVVVVVVVVVAGRQMRSIICLCLPDDENRTTIVAMTYYLWYEMHAWDRP